MSDLDKELLHFLKWGLVVVVIILAGSYWWELERCKQRAISFNGYQFGIIAGCMVKHNGRWLPLDNIRGFDDQDNRGE